MRTREVMPVHCQEKHEFPEGMMLLQSVISLMPPEPTALPWAREFEEERNERLQKYNFSAQLSGH